MDSSIFNNPLFQNLSPEKLKFLMEFHNQQKPDFMNTMKQAQQKGINFTKDESSLLINLLLQNMPESERSKAEMLLMMMKKGRA